MKRPATGVYALLTVVALAVLVRAWVFVYLHMISPAWFDLWVWVDEFQRWVDGRYTLHDLLKPHYEHRIVPARILLLLDSALFDMNGWLPVVCNLIFLGLTGWLIWRLARPDGAVRPSTALPSVFWIALVSSVCQINNLLSAFQVAISSACFAAVSAACLLGAATSSIGLRATALAAAAGLMGILAAFSLGGGIFLAPALLLLLLLRRATPAVWAVFTPLSILGVVLFFHHYTREQAAMPPLLDWHLTIARFLYVGNFLASALNYFTDSATFIGLGAVALFGLAFVAIARAWWFRRAVAAGDATLAALGTFFLMCAGAGTLTVRLNFGPGVALVDRYATMSLMFVAVLFGLLIRWAERAAAPTWVQRGAVPAAALLMLGVFNLPYYDRAAASLNRVANADADLLVNNVAVQGPAPVIFFGTPDDVRGRVVFLHQQKINMFAPENRPPAGLLARLHGSGPWPACRGYVDHAYSIDDTGFMLRAWLADSQGQHSAPWIAVLDAGGDVLGTARALDPRPDVATSLNMASEAFGFYDGFRLSRARTDPNAIVALQVVGLFPGEPEPICVLSMPVSIGPVPIEPLMALRDPSAASLMGKPDDGGFTPLQGAGDIESGRILTGIGAWGVATPGQTGGVLRFRVDMASAPGRALALPFTMAGEQAGARIDFLLADGTRVGTDLPTLFGRPDWRAAILPPALLARHAGPVTIEVQGAGGASLVVGAPLLVSLRAEWSRIF